MNNTTVNLNICNASDHDQETAAGYTQMATMQTEGMENSVSAEELSRMLGTASEPSIGVLENMTTIGFGGIGTVFAAHDPVLHREIAIKVLRPAYCNKLDYVTSFIREARITAQIDHPNVIPVHRLGMFDDAGAYFTMKRVNGVTLSQILRGLKNGDHETQKTYTRQRLLEIFISICNGVAFAHSKGIIHRDLKPANIMVGNYGEVFIADWGLAIYRAENDCSQQQGKIKLGNLPEQQLSENPTGSGKAKVSGTPAFMAPEQVTGSDTELDAQTDVYALGTILYSILTWEQSPYDNASTVTQIMQNVVYRKFQRPRRRSPHLKIPYELEAVTLKAMHKDKAQRYKTVIDLLEDVRNYIAKYPVSAYSPLPHYRLYKLIRRRPLVPVTLLAALLTWGIWNASQALQNYVESRSLLSALKSSLSQSEEARNMAITSRNQLNELFSRTGKTETHGQAVSMKSRYLTYRNEFMLACNNSWEHLIRLMKLGADPARLAPLCAQLMNGQILFANKTGDNAPMLLAATHLQQLPPNMVRDIFRSNPNLQKRISIFKQNLGELQIKTVPGATIRAVKLTPAVAGKSATDAPAVINIKSDGSGTTLSSGNYNITAELPGRKLLQFPVHIEREKMEVINLPFPEKYPENMVYIPEGTFIFGDRTFDDQQVRMYLPGFFIAQHEVTIREYLQFWRTLSPEKREYFRAYVDAPPGRKMRPLWDADGNVLAPYNENMPVIGITTEAVEAYCSYMTARTAFKYRLPSALEWEKAARGTDGRTYVWGNDYRPGVACINDSPGSSKLPAAVGSSQQDKSVYGIFDMMGNARELVTNNGQNLYYTAKGSSFALSPRFARAANHAYASNLSDVGFRCVAESK